MIQQAHYLATSFVLDSADDELYTKNTCNLQLAQFPKFRVHEMLVSTKKTQTVKYKSAHEEHNLSKLYAILMTLNVCMNWGL